MLKHLAMMRRNKNRFEGTQMHTQSSTLKMRAGRLARALRPEYIAAVRYPDGRRDMFHILNADDIDDARDLVISEVGDVQSVMIALRH